MNEVFLLGFDYGTGGAKSTIINSQGEELSYAFENDFMI